MMMPPTKMKRAPSHQMQVPSNTTCEGRTEEVGSTDMDEEHVALDVLNGEHAKHSATLDGVLEIVYNINRERDGACKNGEDCEEPA